MTLYFYAFVFLQLSYLLKTKEEIWIKIAKIITSSQSTQARLCSVFARFRALNLRFSPHTPTKFMTTSGIRHIPLSTGLLTPSFPVATAPRIGSLWHPPVGPCSLDVCVVKYIPKILYPTPPPFHSLSIHAQKNTHRYFRNYLPRPTTAVNNRLTNLSIYLEFFFTPRRFPRTPIRLTSNS